MQATLREREVNLQEQQHALSLKTVSQFVLWSIMRVAQATIEDALAALGDREKV